MMMRETLAILVVSSSSVVLPPNPPHQPHPRSKPKNFNRSRRSLVSDTPLLSAVRWDSSNHRVKYFAHLASNLAEEGRFRDFLMIAENVVVSGVKHSQFLALLNVKRVSAGIRRVLSEGKLASAIEALDGVKKLGFGVIELFDEFAIEALRRECHRRLVECDNALEIVDLIKTLHGFGFSIKEVVGSSDIIGLCVNKRDPTAAIRYVQIFPQVQMLFCSIMMEFGKRGDLLSALIVFEASKQSQDCPNMYTYRTIIDVCGLCGDYLKSRSIYEELLACKFAPNIYVFNSLMNVNASDLSYSLKIYKQMQKVGVTADLASYNILLKSCCLAARVDLAKDIYKEVQRLEATGVLKLDVFTYSTMIKVLADARMWQMALNIKEDMLLSGVIPNTVTWSTLISACANVGLIEQAIQLFEEMLEAGCEPNSQCCNVLLHACVEACQYDRAFRLFKSWKGNGIQKAVSEDLHSKDENKILLDYEHENSRKLCSTSRFQHQWSPMRYPFRPTTSTYNILMKACGTDYFRAKALMDEMKLEGLYPNHISWSILIDIFGGSGNINGALQILRSMHRAGVQSDVVTYTTAIKVCVEHKNLKFAFSLFAEMKRYQIKPNLVTYNTLLKARSKYGSLEEVQQCLAIYQDMRKAGYKPNDYYLKQLIEEWCEGVTQNSYQNNDQFTPCKSASLGPHSLLLEKVAEHLQDSNAESVSIDLQGLTKIEARIVVLAVLRMIKEKYSAGDSVKDDLLIILEDEESGTEGRCKIGVTEAIIKLLQHDLGLEVLSAGSRFGKDIGAGLPNPFASYPNCKEFRERTDLPIKMESHSRRPVALKRLKITEVSLYNWLQRRGGASTTSE